MVKLLRSLIAASALLLAASASLSFAESEGSAAGTGLSFKGTPPLVINGYRFFDSSTKEYFGIRGVNYYPRPNTGARDANNLDLFTDKFARLRDRDFPQFVALGANAIRLYAVDPDLDHTAFMCELQAEGIYVVVDLGSSCQGCEITPDRAPTCYPAAYKTRGEKIIKQFAKFDNVIGFSGGNEVNHRSAGKGLEANAPCQKMFVRDMRNYIAKCTADKSSGMRQIPVGLVTADSDRDLNALYYNCESSDLGYERAEWYGINTYIQCDDIDDPKKATGFNMLRDSFKGYKYSIPVILTEFGCTTDRFPTVKGYKGQRTFHDAQWMNSADYSEYFAGGFAFEYSTENANSKSSSVFPFTEFGPQNYGLGYLYPEDCDDVSKPCSYTQMPNFQSLAKAYKAADTSAEPTFDKFKPAADRTGPTKCPADYLPISGLKWEGGVNPTTECPLAAQVKFQCPKNPRKPLLEGVALDDAGFDKPRNLTSLNTTKRVNGNSNKNKTQAPIPVPTTKTPSSPGNDRENLDSGSSESGSMTKSNSTNGNSTGSNTKTSGGNSLTSSGLVTVALAVVLALLQDL